MTICPWPWFWKRERKSFVYCVSERKRNRQREREKAKWAPLLSIDLLKVIVCVSKGDTVKGQGICFFSSFSISNWEPSNLKGAFHNSCYKRFVPDKEIFIISNEKYANLFGSIVSKGFQPYFHYANEDRIRCVPFSIHSHWLTDWLHFLAFYIGVQIDKFLVFISHFRYHFFCVWAPFHGEKKNNNNNSDLL